MNMLNWEYKVKLREKKYMKKSRRELEIALNSILEENNKNETVLESFISELTGKFYRGRATRIFDKSIQLTLLSNEELCLVTQALYKSTEKSKINPEKWFLEMEQEDASKIILLNGEEDSEPIVEFKDFVKKSKKHDEWLGYMSYRDIQALYERGLLTYNQNTQRKATIIERKGKRYVLPTIFKNSVANIAKQMVADKFHTNAITFNITKTLKEEIFYNKETKSLKVPINENTEVAIIDGAHRILGIVKALNIRPELDNQICVIIKNLTVEEAQEFIHQESLTNRQDLNSLRKTSTRDSYIEMAKTIARMGDSSTNILYNKIDFLDEDANGCLVTGEKFAMGLKDNFKDLYESGESGQLMDMVKYIVEFFKHIADCCPYEFNGEYDVLRRRSISTCGNFYVGMLAYARKLYGNDDWKEELEDVLEEMSWDIKDKTWKEYGVTIDAITIKTKRKLYEYFNSL